MRRIALPTAALVLAIASVCAPAQEPRLPDIGSSAGELLTPAQQEQYGAMLLAQLRQYDYLLEDPLLDQWLDGMGNRLATHSDRPGQSFNFFMINQRQINAFATLGGYIGVNAGLVLAAQREDEVAAVMAHEIAHVTQHHVLRGVERAQRDQLPILLAMLGAVAVASASDSRSGDNAAQAAIVSAMGLMQQRQIDYTRSNEHEADRLGIQTLARSQYDPMAMADFFGTMQARARANAAGAYDAPEYLMTHPVTTTRITEAKERAGQIAQAPQRFTGAVGGSDNPLLPERFRLPAQAVAREGSDRFEFARERMRVLTANTPAEAVREYTRMQAAGPLTDAQRYGLAIARLRDSQAPAARDALQALHAERPGDTWIALALGEAEARTGRTEAADARFEAVLRGSPHDRAAALTYASVLSERNTPDSGRRAQAILRPLLARAADDAVFQRTFARVSDIAGDVVRAGEAHAEAAFLNGRPEQALVQLNTLKQRPEVDYYARARIESRIAAITPTVLELKRQGIRDEDLRRR